jgi:fumarate reductase flavoprotein subunit
LFAAGECVGGVLGDVYVGSGNALANALVFGRVAGRSAALSVPAAVA